MLFTAFFMGLVGSLHCAIMCGPLTLAVPVTGQSRGAILRSRLVYHLGRLIAYILLGALFGLLGKSLLLAGFQQWLSITAGLAMLGFLLLGWAGLKSPMWKSSAWLKAVFRKFIQRRSYLALLILGAANGLLPCGLVYMAATASAAWGSVLQSMFYMVLFGLGTLPMMLGIAFCGVGFTRIFSSPRFRPAIPAAACLVAFALILRGMGLGIPYLSPSASGGKIECASCLKK
jgi:sulfite exporter TauE/SafE